VFGSSVSHGGCAAAQPQALQCVFSIAAAVTALGWQKCCCRPTCWRRMANDV
jgi:hypothetical protein